MLPFKVKFHEVLVMAILENINFIFVGLHVRSYRKQQNLSKRKVSRFLCISDES